MTQQYRHHIIRLNHANRLGYQLHISQISQPGEPLLRAQWNFQTLKGLLAFLRKHFPDSELLHQEDSRYICAQVAWGLNTGNPISTQTEKIVEPERDMTNRYYLDHAIGSNRSNLVKTSYA